MKMKCFVRDLERKRKEKELIIHDSQKEVLVNMPCEKYKSEAQRKLCFATKEWTDWKAIKKQKERYGKKE